MTFTKINHVFSKGVEIEDCGIYVIVAKLYLKNHYIVVGKREPKTLITAMSCRYQSPVFLRSSRNLDAAIIRVDSNCPIIQAEARHRFDADEFISHIVYSSLIAQKIVE